jgi:hypothetical protein
MKHFDKYPSGNNSTGKLVGILLSPSWLSGLVAVTLAICLVALTIASIHYKGSTLQIQVQNFQDQRSQATAANYNGIDNPTHGRLVEDLPLIAFWSLLGLVVYMFAENIVTGLQHLNQLRDSLTYVHADRHKTLIEAVERLAIRVAVLAIWLPYIVFFFHEVIPYCITTAEAAGAQSLSMFTAGGYVLLAISVFFVTTHLHAILLRLLLLKPRAFSSVVYAD